MPCFQRLSFLTCKNCYCEYGTVKDIFWFQLRVMQFNIQFSIHIFFKKKRNKKDSNERIMLTKLVIMNIGVFGLNNDFILYLNYKQRIESVVLYMILLKSSFSSPFLLLLGFWLIFFEVLICKHWHIGIVAKYPYLPTLQIFESDFP